MNPANPARARRPALGTIVLLMLPNLLWLARPHDIVTWVQALVLPSCMLITLFALLGRRPWLACLLLAPFEIYYVAQYHHPTSAEIIATIVATNPRETREYFGALLMPLALCLAAGLALACLAAWWSFRAGLRWRGRLRAAIVAIAIATPLATAVAGFAGARGTFAARAHAGAALLQTLADQVQPGYPFGVFQRLAEYRRESDAMRADAAKLDAFRFHAHRTGPQPHRRQVYVLVIGESSRRDHWQLF